MRKIGQGLCVMGFVAGLFCLHPAAAEETLKDAFRNGKILIDTRLRYEHVGQENFTENANALTLRARFGFETAPLKGFTVLAEGDFTRALGVDDFNNTVNGKVSLPVVADLDSLRLNQLSLRYAGVEKTTLTVGRQRIILDDARFVGNVGFRQNEQTFDAVRLTTRIIAGAAFDYIYLWRVNRIFGSRSPAGQTGADSHLIRVAWEDFPLGTLSGYAYLVELDKLPALSGQTYGVRLTGKRGLGKGIEALYTAGVAHQTDYGNSPAGFGLDFVELEGGLSYRGFLAKAGYQLLEGNGGRGFQTPLATLHAFQGFADVFLTTPASGLEDRYLILGWRAEGVRPFGAVSLTLWLHDFAPDQAGPDLGEEADFEIAVTPVIQKQKIRFSLKVADFSGSPVLPDVTKVWLAAEWAF